MNHGYNQLAIMFLFLFFFPSWSSASDTNPPLWKLQNQSTNSTFSGEYIILTGQARDDTSLDKAILSTNETGIWENKTGKYDSPMDMKYPIVAWARKTEWDLPSNGTYSAPALGDLDNDGDYDLMVGYNNGITYAYQNNGSIMKPAWIRKSSWDVPDIGVNAAPALADLDNDGDLDLLIGGNAGISYGYENEGSTLSPIWIRNSSWDTPNIGSYSAIPALADLDNDGDFDLMIGGIDSSLNYLPQSYTYENTGTLDSPVWTRRQSWDERTRGGIAFADIDNDGDYDIMKTYSYPYMFKWSVGVENTGNAYSPVWTLKNSWNTGNIIQEFRPIPASGDLDNDGDYDLLIGGYNGVLYAIENTGVKSDAWKISNFMWENSSIPGNTTIGWKIWYGDTSGNWNSTDIMTFSLKNKQPLFTENAEYMVSPAGWLKTSPIKYRTINITAALLDPTGRYITGLSSLEAQIFDPSGEEIGIVQLTGYAVYTGNFILSDGISDGVYTIKLRSYDLKGSFRVLRWTCSNCHDPDGLQDGWRYHGNSHTKADGSSNLDVLPSTFEKNIVHNHSISSSVPAYCSQNGFCHGSLFSNGNRCSQCHRQTQLVCQDCHADNETLDSINSIRYGSDIHSSAIGCIDCHGSLPDVSRSVSCTTCHSQAGSNLKDIPASIKNMSHSKNETVSCALCHNSEHDIRSLSTDESICKICHPGIVHNNGAQCTTCHGIDPHNVSVGGCIACHSFSEKRYFVNTSFFGRHANLNKSDGSNNVSDEDCKTCHFGAANGSLNMELGAANDSNTYFCQDCHTSTGRNPDQYNNITDYILKKEPMPPGHGNNGCRQCHIAGADRPRPLEKALRYHSHGPKGYSDFD